MSILVTCREDKLATPSTYFGISPRMHRKYLIGQTKLLKQDGDFDAVRRTEGVEVDVALGGGHCGQMLRET